MPSGNSLEKIVIPGNIAVLQRNQKAFVRFACWKILNFRIITGMFSCDHEVFQCTAETDIQFTVVRINHWQRPGEIRKDSDAIFLNRKFPALW